jgi:hypothetical protein
MLYESIGYSATLSGKPALEGTRISQKVPKPLLSVFEHYEIGKWNKPVRNRY